MAELTLDQKRALAIAEARRRMEEAGASPEWAGKVAAYKTEIEDIERRGGSMAPVEKVAATTGLAFDKAKDMLISMGIRGGGAALGQVAGRETLGRIPVIGRPIGERIGAGAGAAIGSVADQARLMAEGKQERIMPGQVAGDVMGAVLPGRGMASNALANVAATQAESLIDRGQPASMEQSLMSGGAGALGAATSRMMTGAKRSPTEIKRSREDETYALARREGYILDPAKAAPDSSVAKAAVALAGEPQLHRELSLKNQQVTNNIARKELGISDMVDGQNLPITEEVLAYNKWLVAEPYRRLAEVADEAPAVMKELSAKRNEAKTLWRKYAKDASPEAAEGAALADEAAEKLETRLEELARNSGQEGLVDEVRAARKLLAKNHVIDSALNKGNSDISAVVIGRMYDSGKVKLTEGLETIGRLQLAMPKVLAEASKTSAPGGGHLRTWMTGAAAYYGGQMGGIPGALAGAGAVAYGDIPLRKAAQTNIFQRSFGTASYPNVPNPEDFAAAIARLAPAAAGRRQEEMPHPAFLRYMTNPSPFTPNF